MGVSPALALRGRAMRCKSSFASLTAGFSLLSLTQKQGKNSIFPLLIEFCFTMHYEGGGFQPKKQTVAELMLF